MRLDAGIWIQLGNSALALAIAVGVGTLGAEWIRQQTLQLPPPAPAQNLKPAPPPQDSGKSQQAFAPILDQNVFRAQKQEAPLPPVPPPTSDPTTPDTQVIPQTNLNVALTGTMIFGPKNAFAFISSRNQLANYRIYELGECFDPNSVTPTDCTPGTVKVLEVMDREVVLVFRDQKQRLLMEEAPGTPSAASPPAQRAPQTAALVVPPASKPAPQPASPAPQSSSSSQAPPPAAEGQTTFNFTRSWVDEQLANFNQILMDARVVATETEPPRFMFKYIKKGSLYEQLGLKTNDVILEVNGFVIDSLPKALKLMETLQAEREIALKVERDETPIVFNYYID